MAKVPLILILLAICLSDCRTDSSHISDVCFSSESRQGQHGDIYADPVDCHFYVQCFYHNQTSADAIRRQCPPNQFWSNRIVSCVPELPNMPCQDPCLQISNVSCYGVADSCSAYFTCSNMISHRMCCPLGTAFQESTCTCVLKPKCSDVCVKTGAIADHAEPKIVDLERGICLDPYGNYLQAEPSKPSKFYIYQYPPHINFSALSLDDKKRLPVECPEKTLFDVATCSCSITIDATVNPPVEGCLLELPFDNDLDDHSKQGFIGFKVGQNSTSQVQQSVFHTGTGSLMLDGKGHIEYPGLKSIAIDNEASWCFFYGCPDGGCQSDGAVMSSSDCDIGQQFAIKIRQRSSGTIEVVASFQNNTIMLSAPSAPVGTFAHVCVVYGNATLSLYLNNVLADASLLVEGDGNLQTSYCPLLIGHDLNGEYFAGYVDDVIVCQMALSAQLQTMHFNMEWRGDRDSEFLRTFPGDDKQTWPTPQSRINLDATLAPVTPPPRPPGEFCAYVAWRGVGWLPNPVYYELPSNVRKAANRIINGQTLEQGDSPWTVSLFSMFKGDIAIGYHCTGTLLDSQWVLTSASCIYRGYNWYILGPSSNIRIDIGFSKTPDAQKGGEYRDYLMALRHCDFFYGTNDAKMVHPYNVALIRLDEPVNFTSYIDRANLPPEACCDSDSASLANKNVDSCGEVVVTGWGSNFGKLSKSPALSLATRIECEQIYNINLHAVQFCAKHANSGVCDGDMGATAICSKSVSQNAVCRKPFIVGLVAWQNHKCNVAYPSGFTRICPIVPWLKASMAHFAKSEPPPTTTSRPPEVPKLCSYVIRRGEDWQTTPVNYPAARFGHPNERIINANAVTSRSNSPWMALLRVTYSDGKPPDYSSGVLVHPQWVLTSAVFLRKTLTKNSKLHVTLGETSPFGVLRNGSVTEEFSHAVRHCDQKNERSLNGATVAQPYNIAMVKLAKPVPPSEFIKPIAMAFDVGACQSNVIPWDDWVDGCKKVSYAGWGADKPSNNFSQVLRTAEARIINNERCEMLYSSFAGLTRLFDQFCGADLSNMSASCGDADHGGPAVCIEHSHCNLRTNTGRCPKLPYLVGVSNWGACQAGAPTSFTRVCFVAEWIKATIKFYS